MSNLKARLGAAAEAGASTNEALGVVFGTTRNPQEVKRLPLSQLVPWSSEEYKVQPFRPYSPQEMNDMMENMAAKGLHAVFVGLDDHGTPRNAFQRGITDKSTFKNGVEGSDKTWPFLMPSEATSDTLAVFEGAIDAISHATIVKAKCGDWQQITRTAVGGNFPIEAITKYLDAHPEVIKIALALDNDETGQRLVEYITAGLSGRQLTFTPLLQPAGKDWNQFLTDYWSARTR